MNDVLKSLNPTEVLRNNINQFKEAFVEFYGEDSRNEIEEKFSKMLPIAYTRPDKIDTILRDLEKIITNQIIDETIQIQNLSISKKDLFEDYSFTHENLQPIYKYQNFFEVYSLSFEQRQARFYDIGYQKINRYLKELTKEEYIKVIETQQVPEKARFRQGTSYEHTLFLVKDFFYEFKDKIIESRKNGNIQVIWNEVGKNNFDELNSLFEIYNENFSGFKIYNLLSDLREKKDTELTKVYYDLVDKKNNIMENMRRHQALSKEDYYGKKETI